MSGVVLTRAQARELRRIADTPGCIRLGALSGKWFRFDGAAPVATLRPTTVLRLIEADVACPMRTPARATRAVLLLTPTGRAWLEQHP